MEAREALEQQRVAISNELDATAEEYANLDAVTEFAARWGKALRAVLELHTRVEDGECDVPFCDWCSDAYPCPTVEAITNALAGEG